MKITTATGYLSLATTSAHYSGMTNTTKATKKGRSFEHRDKQGWLTLDVVRSIKALHQFASQPPIVISKLTSVKYATVRSILNGSSRQYVKFSEMDLLPYLDKLSDYKFTGNTEEMLLW